MPWVIANPGSTVEVVAGRFGYTNSELLADLDLIFVCGLPGYGPGDLMEAYVEDDQVIVDMADYFSRPLRLSPPEALGLLASGMALASTEQAPPALERAVEKLAAAAVVISVSRAVKVVVTTKTKAVDIISLLHKALRKVVNKADIIKLHKVAVSRSLKHRQWQSQTLILTMTFRSRQRQNTKC